jgi:hypothetical protein
MTADLETAEGKTIRLLATGMKGATVWATAPRLSVAAGMILRGRVIRPEETRPWVVELEIEDAAFHTNELARVRMRAVRVAPDDSRRMSARIPVGGVAWLVAVNCRDVVDGDRIEGTIIDLSTTGVAFATRRVLRIGDRMTFHGRFFAEHVEAEVRVTSLRPGAHERAIAGCAFIEISAEQKARVARLIASADTAPPPRAELNLGALRDAAADDGTAGGWRGIFRR